MHPCKPLATLFLSIFMLLFSPSSFSGTTIEGCQLLLDAGFPSRTSVSLGVLSKLTIRDCSKGVCTLGFECGSGVCAEKDGRPIDLISLAVIADRATIQQAIKLMPGCKAGKASQPTSRRVETQVGHGGIRDTYRFEISRDIQVTCNDGFKATISPMDTGGWWYSGRRYEAEYAAAGAVCQ